MHGAGARQGTDGDLLRRMKGCIINTTIFFSPLFPPLLSYLHVKTSADSDESSLSVCSFCFSVLFIFCFTGLLTSTKGSPFNPVLLS